VADDRSADDRSPLVNRLGDHNGRRREVLRRYRQPVDPFGRVLRERTSFEDERSEDERSEDETKRCEDAREARGISVHMPPLLYRASENLKDFGTARGNLSLHRTLVAPASDRAGRETG
jgi:hypothetical protein